MDLLFTVSGQPATIRNLDASSTSTSQILTGTGADVLLPVGGTPQARIVWDATALKWALQLSGVHQEPTVNVANFGASPSASAATNDAAFVAAYNAIVALGGGEIVIPHPGPSGFYAKNAEWQINTPGITVRGAGCASGGTGVVLKATSAMRSLISVNGGYNCLFDDLVLEQNFQAVEGVYRQADGNSVYKRVQCYHALEDGFHAAGGRDGWSFGTVTQTGGDPLVTLSQNGQQVPKVGEAYQLDILLSHTVASGLLTFQLKTPGSFTSDTYTVPTTGVVSVGYPAGASDGIDTYPLGFLITFPAGSYTSGNKFSFTITIPGGGTQNGSTRFEDCGGSLGGNCYVTAGWTTARTNLEFTVRELNTSVAAGTVALAAGSKKIVGTGTAFLSGIGLRPGDFIRVNAAPDWQPSTVYNNGDLVYATQFAPGKCFIFQAGGVTGDQKSGGSPPDWPFNGPTGGTSSPIGQTVVDNHVTWTCYEVAVFQVLNVRDDFTIILADIGLLPQNSDSGLDFVACKGSGFYEEISGNNNNCLIDGGVWNSNGACGVMTTANFEDQIDGVQPSNNGAMGVAIGLSPVTCYDTQITGRTYIESSMCAHIYVSTAQGLDISHPVIIDPSAMPVLYSGDGAGGAQPTFGTWRGSALLDFVVDQPIGRFTRSRVPVTQSSLLEPFRIQQGLNRTSIVSALSASTDQIPATNALVYVQANPSAGVSLGNGAVHTFDDANSQDGDEVHIVFQGSYQVTLQDNNTGPLGGTLLVLESPTVTFKPGDQCTFRRVGSGGSARWYQGAISRRPQVFTTGAQLGLVSGTNSDVPNPFYEWQEAADQGGAITLTGIVAGNSATAPGTDGQIIEIAYYGTNAAHTFTVTDQATSAAANQIITPTTGTDLVLTPGTGGVNTVRLRYSMLKAKWIVLASQ